MAVFRLDGALERSPAVEAWLAVQAGPLGEEARRWFAQLLACGDEVRELMHDGFATACFGNAAFAYVAVYSRHAALGFFHGAELTDPSGLLRGTGKRMRHVRLQPGLPVDTPAVERLIGHAYEDIRHRVECGD